MLLGVKLVLAPWGASTEVDAEGSELLGCFTSCCFPPLQCFVPPLGGPAVGDTSLSPSLSARGQWSVPLHTPQARGRWQTPAQSTGTGVSGVGPEVAGMDTRVTGLLQPHTSMALGFIGLVLVEVLYLRFSSMLCAFTTSLSTGGVSPAPTPTDSATFTSVPLFQRQKVG